MPYCKLYNIKSTKFSFQININRIIYFRFITPDKLQGIKFKNKFNTYIETENLYNIQTINNWYKYSKNIDFSILNDYKYLVLQIYALNENDLVEIEQNNTFSITNENEWYTCNDEDDTCGLKLYNQVIVQNKPIQEIEECLKYTINGSAKIIETKYLKSGYEDSNILITSFNDNIINYISEFKLDKIKVNNKINKNPLSVNKYIDLDKLVPTAELTESEDFNSVNNKLEMIKLQLKNYFIENNSEVDKLEISVNQQECNTEINKLKIDSINHTLKDYNITFEQYNTQFKNINIEFEEIKLNETKNNDDITSSINIITDKIINIKNRILDVDFKLDNFQKTIDSLTCQSDISDINIKLDNFQNTIDNLINQPNVSDINIRLDNFQKTIDNLTNEQDIKLDNFQKTIDNLTNQQDIKLDNFQKTIDNLTNQPDISDINIKLDNFQKTIDSKCNKINIYANDTHYMISHHNTNWNINFVTETNKYEVEKFYMVKDEFKSVSIPYYCWSVKNLNNGCSMARLFPVIPITNIYF